MRILKLHGGMIEFCCMAIIFIIGCASKQQIEPTSMETSQETSTQADTTAVTTAAYEEITLNVDGMMCGGCEAKVKSALTAIPGVVSADVSDADDQAIVKLEEGKATVAQLTNALEKAGFSAETAN